MVQPRLSRRTSVGGIRDRASGSNTIAVSNPTEIIVTAVSCCCCL
jgi:hypothetical protein